MSDGEVEVVSSALIVDPFRLIVDVQGVHEEINGNVQTVQGSIVQQVRARSEDAGMLRVVFDLDAGVGHRVVQGGARFVAPTVIDKAVVRTVEELSPLAPLHNPPNLLGIQAAQITFPDIPHVAIFDTAFHQTMPPEAYTYAIDRTLAQQYRIRRYGFHGTSHKYVSELAAEHLRQPLHALAVDERDEADAADEHREKEGVAVECHCTQRTTSRAARSHGS